MNPAPIKPLISTSDLDKIDVRVGTILAVEDVAHSENARTAACRFRRPRALHSRRHEKERPSPKPDGPFATQTATRAILFSLAKGLNHAATDALSSCRPERHVRDAEGKVDTGLPLDCQRLQDNRPIRSAGQRIGSRAGTDGCPRGGA